jgi:hypothetical protein
MNTPHIKHWFQNIQHYLKSISKYNVSELEEIEKMRLMTIYDKLIQHINGDNLSISKMIRTPLNLTRRANKTYSRSRTHILSRTRSRSRSQSLKIPGGGHEGEENDENKPSCMICFDRINENELCHHNSLDHRYHYTCIRKWLDANPNNPTCPNCTVQVQWTCNGRNLLIVQPPDPFHAAREARAQRLRTENQRGQALQQNYQPNIVRDGLVNIILFIVWVIHGFRMPER